MVRKGRLCSGYNDLSRPTCFDVGGSTETSGSSVESLTTKPQSPDPPPF